jgi:hypothetical protein
LSCFRNDKPRLIGGVSVSSLREPDLDTVFTKSQRPSSQRKSCDFQRERPKADLGSGSDAAAQLF